MRATRLGRLALTLPTFMLGALCPLLAPGRAEAYVRTKSEGQIPLRWENPCIPVQLYTGNTPAPMTPAVLLKATKAAAAAWGRPAVYCSGLQISVQGVDEPTAPVARDGVNRVIVRTDEWCRESSDPNAPCYDKIALAITTVTASKADGRIMDADIEINGISHTWDDLAVKGASPEAHDLQTMLTHEFGHFVGLEHNCYVSKAGLVDHAGKLAPACAKAPAAIQGAVMYPTVIRTDISRRKLSTDEQKAACDIYPTAAGSCTITSTKPLTRADAGAPAAGDAGTAGVDEAAGCALGGSNGGSGGTAALLLALAAIARRARRRR